MSDADRPAPFDAVLLVGPGAEQPLGGLTLAERALFVLARAGAARVLCFGRRPPAPVREPPVAVTWTADPAAIAPWSRAAAATVVGTEATALLQPAVVAALARAPGGGALRAAGPVLLWRCARDHLPAIVPALQAAPPDQSPAGLAAAAVWHPPAASVPLPARTPTEHAAAERALYAGLGRAGDGWLTRHLDRRVSRALTRRLVGTGVAPNTVTMIAIALGLAAGLLFAVGHYAAAVAGACLFLASTILDGCDGELARLTFRESPFGARLDLVGDNLVHLVLFGGIAVGLQRDAPDRSVAVLGILLVTGVLLAMAVVYRCLVAREPTPGQRALFESFASREFVYLLVVLTVAGRLEWFLWLAALGTYAFVAALLALGARRPLTAPRPRGGG